MRIGKGLLQMKPCMYMWGAKKITDVRNYGMKVLAGISCVV